MNNIKKVEISDSTLNEIAAHVKEIHKLIIDLLPNELIEKEAEKNKIHYGDSFNMMFLVVISMILKAHCSIMKLAIIQSNDDDILLSFNECMKMIFKNFKFEPHPLH